jgi:hypothetical protein
MIGSVNETETPQVKKLMSKQKKKFARLKKMAHMMHNS